MRESRAEDGALVDEHRTASREESGRYRGAIMDVAGSDVAESDPVLALIAEVAGEPVGSLVAGETAPGTWMVLSVYAVPEVRGIGVGDALMDEFRRRAARAGVRRLLSRALPGDRETKNLFERHGFTAQMIVLGSSPVAESGD